jgi:hypothetical protein
VVQFYIGSVSLDSDHHLWMAWDRALVRFDPSTHATASFALPSFASLGVHPSLYSGEGTFVAVTVDGKGEVWAAASKVAALFGFNSISHRWDRVIHLPWFPSYDTTLAEPRPGLLTVNGYRTPDDKAVYQTFAKIDTATGRLTQMSQPAWSYSLVSDHEAIFLGEDGALFKLDIDTGETTPLVSNAPVDRSNGRAQFALSRDGHLWFGMAGYRSLGLGELDMASAAVNTYPFPYIDQPGKQLPDTNHCANSRIPDCVPSTAIAGTDIEAIVVDARQDVWVVTDWPAGYLNDPLLMTPVIELKAIVS